MEQKSTADRSCHERISYTDTSSCGKMYCRYTILYPERRFVIQGIRTSTIAHYWRMFVSSVDRVKTNVYGFFFFWLENLAV